jgi:hypothetical protein
VRAFIKTRLVRIGLVISVDQDHGTRMGHIASSPATDPVTHVGYTSVIVVVDKRENTAIIVTCAHR